MKKLANKLCIAALTLISSVPALAVTETRLNVDLNKVFVNNLIVNGSGCPSGMGASFSVLRNAIIVEADEMVAIFDRDVSRVEARKFCQFAIDLDVPAGWTYAVNAVIGSLEYDLNGNTKLTAKYNSYFEVGQTQGEASYSPRNSGYDFSDYYMQMDAPAYAPCNAKRSMKVKQSIALSGTKSNPNNSGFARLDGPTVYLLKWKRCS